MKMEPKNVLQMVIAVAIGVIMLGPLASVVAGAQENVGPETNLTNSVSADYTYNLWNGEDITFEFTKGTPNTYSVNGETVTLNAAQQILIASNFFSMRSGGLPANPGINYEYLGSTAGAEDTLSYVIENGEYTLTIGDTVLTGTLDWMVYAVADGKTGTSGLGQLTTPASAFYTSNANKIVVLGNIYTTGDNDTYYAYYDGKLTVNEDYEDNSKVNIVKTIANGYTDIYSTTLSVSIGEETFTPYFVLAPITISGHEASESMYDLLGVIPLLVTIGLILGIVGVVAVRRLE
jgi:hypothetical protein